MKKVAFYGRYSSANQTEQSIEGQRHVCEKYAATNDLQIVAEYIDRAQSGTTDKRQQFQKMIADSASGLFDAILVYKLDRFARNRYDSALYKKRLRDNGVRVISATEAISDSPEGIIMEGLLEAMDEYYSAELARKMRRGTEESFRKGKYITHVPPFGYKLTSEHTLTLDDATAPIVKEMFVRYQSGQKIGLILKWLNGMGITTVTGKPWSTTGISRMMRHTLYKGEYRYGSLDGLMPCPAIVDAELFDAVQERLKNAPKRARNRSAFQFILTGKLICSKCGGNIGGTSANGKWHYYRCRKCQCDGPSVRAEELHERVLSALDTYLTKEKVDEIAEAAFESYTKDEVSDERPAIERELQSVQHKLQNATDAILRGVDLDLLTGTIETLKAQREALRASLDALSVPIPKLTLDHFRITLEDMAKQSSFDLLNTVVNQIILTDDIAIICINLTDENNAPPLEQILLRFASRGGDPVLTGKIVDTGIFSPHTRG